MEAQETVPPVTHVSVEELLDGVSLDAASPVPVYYQLHEAVRARLTAGEPPPGTRLPTEREIAGALAVSRMTVRKALDRLEREGLLRRRRRAGTYVAEPRVAAGLRLAAGFTAELGGRGHRIATRVVDLAAVRPPAAVRRSLAVPDEAGAVVRLRRVRSLDGVPATFETAWLPTALCAPLLGVDLTDRSLYATLRERCGLVPGTATEQLSATTLDDYEARQLGQPAGSPAFLVERTTLDDRDRPIEHVKSLLRADRFVFTATLDLEVAASPLTARPEVVHP